MDKQRGLNREQYGISGRFSNGFRWVFWGFQRVSVAFQKNLRGFVGVSEVFQRVSGVFRSVP